MAVSNVDLALVNNFGNTGAIPANIEPGIAKAVVLVPKGTTIPAAEFESQGAFQTYVTAAAQGFIADNRTDRWFILQNCDEFKDETKAPAQVDTGLNQFRGVKFNPKWSFRYLTNKANHEEALAFDNTSTFDCFVWDSNGNIWGQKDVSGAGGITAFTLQQLAINDWSPYTVKDINQYTFTVQFKNRAELNENFAIFNTGMDSDSIATLMNAVLTDVSATLGTPLSIATSTDMVCVLKAGKNSIDLASPQYYQGSLTAACFVATDLTAGSSLTAPALHAAGSIVVSGQNYNYLWFRFSPAPVAGHLVQLALAAPSVVNAIIPDFDAVTEIIAPGVNGVNAATHQF